MLGVPIILSDIPVNQELQSPLVSFFKRKDPESLKAVMVELVEHRKTFSRYNQVELIEQGQIRLKRLSDAVNSALQYNLGWDE